MFLAGLVLPGLIAWRLPGLEAALYDQRLGAEARQWWSLSDSADAELHRSIVLLGQYETAQLDKDVRAYTSGNWTASDTVAAVTELLGRGASGVSLSLAGLPSSDGQDYAGLADDPRVALSDGPESSNMCPATAKADSRDGRFREAYLAVGQPPRPTVPLLFFAKFEGVEPKDIVFHDNDIQVGSRTVPCHKDGRGWSIWVRLLPISTETVDSQLAQGGSIGRNDWKLEPLAIQSLKDPQQSLYRLAAGRFFFEGDYQYAATGVLDTSLGKYRSFQYQAVTLDTLIKGWHLRNLSSALAIELGIAWSLWCMSHFLRISRPLQVLRDALGLAILSVGGNLVCFHFGFLLPVLYPLTSLMGVVTVSLVALSSRSLGLVGRFGGEATVRALSSNYLGAAELEVQEREATILFTNLPDYLKELENLEAEDVFDKRSEYSELITRIVGKHGGLVHDYQADYLMIGFGTEIGRPDPTHAQQAVQAAVELELAVSTLNAVWTQAPRSGMDVSCGICTGLVAIGFVGARKYKQAPAAIGDTTNVAARLLVAARKLKVKILMHERTNELLGQPALTEAMPPIELKGKSKPVPIFRWLDET